MKTVRLKLREETLELPLELTTEEIPLLVLPSSSAPKRRKGRNQQALKRRKMGSKKNLKTKPHPKEASMRFAGIDLHKRSLTVCIIDKLTGETFDRRFSCSDEARILKFFKDLGEFQAVVEASATYEWLWELLEPHADRLVLAHPKKIRMIAESMKKTDRNDASFLAWLLSHNAVPEAHCPTPHQREYQLLVRTRQQFVQRRTRDKNQIRAILANRNLDSKSLFAAKGREHLAGLKLRPAEQFRLEQLLASLDAIEEQILATEEVVAEFRRKAPPQEKKNHKILRSMPGVGNVVADAVLSSMGDIRRFPSIRKAAGYSGLAPGYRQSDKKRKKLEMTKEGPRILRWALVEASWTAIRCSAYWREQYERIANRRGKKKAVVGVARRMLGVMYTLLKHQTTYREAPAAVRRLKTGRMAATARRANLRKSKSA
jgi:transposase